MVQLKVLSVAVSIGLMWVSIPNGSIKRTAVLLAHSVASMFQFLMVQLKGRFRRNNRKWSKVSIPNGSIKSCADSRFAPSPNLVSIPNGSIKRITP